MKKKSGSVLIEANIILMIVLSIFTASSKIFMRNLEKGKYLYSREDIRSLAYLEYEFLQEFNNFINEKKDDYVKKKEEGLKLTKDFTIYSNSNFKNYSITLRNNKFYLTHEKNSTKKYIGLDEINKEDKIFFKTNTYKTDYIISS